MSRWLSVIVAAAGIGLVAADAPGTPVPGQSVTIYNSIVTGERLTPLQSGYVSAKVGQLLDARGFIVDRNNTERADEVQKFGDVLCTNSRAPQLIVPAISSSVTGREEGGAAWNTIRVELRVYDCTSHVLHTFKGAAASGYDWPAVVDKSMDDAIKHYLTGRP
jgi:hypothetical protein